jgi:hypothetical protein
VFGPGIVPSVHPVTASPAEFVVVLTLFTDPLPLVTAHPTLTFPTPCPPASSTRTAAVTRLPTAVVTP